MVAVSGVRPARRLFLDEVVSMPSSREFEALFTAALDAVFIADDARVLIAINPAAARLLARPAQDVVGHRFDEFLEHSGEIDAAWEAFLAGGRRTGELRVVRAGGALCDVEYSGTANFVSGQHLGIVRDVTERRAAQAREALRLRETETLLAVSRTLSATLDPTETMRRVAREIAHALDADMVGAYRADPGDNVLWPVAGYRVPKTMLPTFRQFPIPIRNHPAIEAAWHHRRPVWTSDMANDARVHRPTYERFPHQSDVFVPIAIKQRPVGGFFVIWWRERRALESTELRLLQGISALAGIFLENAQLYREAAEANRAKDEFMATLSHELRNPLGAIAHAVAALDHRGGRGEPEVRLRQIIHRQTRHLARLVDELLDVARVTAGKVSLNHRPVDLGDVAAAAVRALQDGARGREHHVTLRTEPVTVNADPTRLEQIVTNLVDNAMKYTPAGGSVAIAVAREGEQAILRVKDTGRGIAPEMLPHVFELFAQGEQPIDRSLGGLGIGLALSRRLVELHDGTIEVHSAGPGQGAEFVVRLPGATPGTPATAVPEPRAAARRRILVVEDSDDSRESLRLLLESLGHEVVAAADGPQGLALALERPPDVMLVDLGLPGLDGFELARAVRRSARASTVRLIALTGYGQAEDRRRSAEAGFDAHLVKPVSASALLGVLG
jgi:PAS domain S-box-containing protein